MKMNNCGRCNVRKHREIKVSYKYVTLDISLKYGSLENMRIKYSEPKDNLGRSGKGVDYLSGFQGQSKAKELQKVKEYYRNCY